MLPAVVFCGDSRANAVGDGISEMSSSTNKRQTEKPPCVSRHKLAEAARIKTVLDSVRFKSAKILMPLKLPS
jgi:hypothetical protein